MTYYPLAYTLNDSDIKRINIKGLFRNPGRTIHIRGVRIGQFREPQAGEWYLSGSVPQCWRAPNNLSTKYHIVRLVKTEDITTTITQIVE